PPGGGRLADTKLNHGFLQFAWRHYLIEKNPLGLCFHLLTTTELPLRRKKWTPSEVTSWTRRPFKSRTSSSTSSRASDRTITLAAGLTTPLRSRR
ncbi:hypothetical protein LINGRAHAP2_LOCUS27041, partial [Linum grandiflorum]